MRKFRILTVLLLSPVLLMALPLSAGAQTASTVTVTVSATSELLDPTLVRVPITITCAPMDVRSVQSNSELRQAVSATQIAYGSGSIEDQIVCDGGPHANSVLFWAYPDGPPFTRGDATVRIPLFLCDPNFTCQNGSSGIQITRVRRPAA